MTLYQNGTIASEDEMFDIEQYLDDLIHFRNLPSAKSLIFGLVTLVHHVLDFFVGPILCLIYSVND